ncbi:TPA: EbhA [Streptococcus pyogenes]|nr:EbhA [Streptococcus pyogenes]
MKKKNTIITALIILLVAVGGLGYYFLSYVPHQEAVINFNKAVKTVQTKNKALKSDIAKAEKLVKSNQQPLDTKTLDSLKATVATAKSGLRKIPRVADKTKAINKQTKMLNQPIDYSKATQSLADSSSAYTNSVRQLNQITSPSQAFIEERLKEIPTITGIQSVTETVDGNDIIAKGSDGGGNVEVYKTAKEAESRNTYISAFDGQGMLNPGSHYVYGTLVIRTSRYLTASQQTALTNAIYNKLIEIKE